MFTLIPSAKPKVLIVLAENLCYKGNEVYLLSHFLQPNNIKPTDVAFFPIPTGKLKKADINMVLPLLHECMVVQGIDTVAICSSELFTYITKNKQFTLGIGSYKKGTIYSFKNKGEPKVELDFTKMNIIPVLNPIVLNKFPNKVTLVNKGLSVIKTIIAGDLDSLNSKTNYLKEETLIKNANTLTKILQKEFNTEALFIDIETTGLNWYKDKLLTISFTTNGSSAYCIALHEQYHSKEVYQQMIGILKRFFLKYQGDLIGHNWIGFDQTFITHEIMRDSNFSIDVAPIVNKFHLQDTMFMAYLLYNSTERPSIGLKNLAFKYLGDWDKDIDQKNLINAPIEKVAHYNNLDVIATYLIYHELKKDIEQEHFEKPYKDWLRYGKQLLKMKMVGLRIDKEQTRIFKDEIYKSMLKDKQDLAKNEKVLYAMDCLTKEKEAKEPLIFNPNSFIHKGYLFFEVLNLTPIAYSKKTKNPSTDKKSLEIWLNDDKVSEEAKEILNLIMEIGLASKIHSTYLKNMLEGAIEVLPNDWRIFAEFNQTSTITGRLSSSGVINMQTIPSSSKYGSAVKRLFIAPEGYILGTIDFGALNK